MKRYRRVLALCLALVMSLTFTATGFGATMIEDAELPPAVEGEIAAGQNSPEEDLPGAPGNEENATAAMANGVLADALGLPFLDDFSDSSNTYTPQWNVEDGVMKITDTGGGQLTLLEGMELPESYTVSADITMYDVSYGTSGNSGGIVFGATSSSVFYHFRLDWSGNSTGRNQSVQLYRWNTSATQLKQAPITWCPGGAVPVTYTLTVTVEGSLINCYVNDDLLITHTVTTPIEGGTVGFRVYNAGMEMDNLSVKEGVHPPEGTRPEPQPVPEVWENFEDGTGFALGSNWSVATTDTGNKVLQGVGVGSTPSILALGGYSLPSTFTLGVDVSFIRAGSASGWSSGPIFQYTDNSNFWHFRYNKGSTAETGMQLYQWAGGAASNKTAVFTQTDLTVGEWYRYWVVCDEGQYRFYLNDMEIGEANAPYTGISQTGGGIGFRAYNGTFHYDNLEVWDSIMEPTGPLVEVPEVNEQIVNNEDDEYFDAENWADAPTGVLGQDGSGVRVTTNPGDYAEWSAYAPASGNYHIWYWNPAADDTKGEVTFTVNSVSGTWRKVLAPENEAAGWVRVATVTGAAGTAINTVMTFTGTGAAFADAIRLEPTTSAADEQYNSGGAGGSTELAVLVNQLGYDTGKSKRATVPNADAECTFQVINAKTLVPAYSGNVVNNVADFTELDPSVKTDYFIRVMNGDGESAESFEFTISKNWMQAATAEVALDFMDQSRQDAWLVGGNTGYGWRDSHQFSFELNSMVLQYMANPAYYDDITGSIYNVERTEYPELQTQGADEPNLVWLMKFGAMRYYDWGTGKNVKLHMLIKEQLAYFLYIYPQISEWVDEDFYTAVRDYTIEVWGENACTKQWYAVPGTNHNLYELQTVFGGLKGAQPPGHSIAPNLMMYEVVLRDGLADVDADAFFDAAYSNTEWLITNADIADPAYNKGQRMSEHVMIENLTYFLEMYPDRAPAGLKSAVQRWAEKTVARSDNMWDFRMAVSLDAGDGEFTFSNGNPLLKDYWTGAAYASDDDQANAIRNEPGNVAGIQGITYAAARVLEDEALNERLREIGIASIDDMFGRNPSGRAYFYSVVDDFEGGDLGWYNYHRGGYGALEDVPGRIDANPVEAAFPYNPSGAQGYTEGWVAYNTAWNTSLAYSAAAETALSVGATTAGVGDVVNVELRAALNMDYTTQETGYVVVENLLTSETWKEPVTEDGVDGDVFRGSITVPNTYAIAVSYGYGLFEERVEITVTDFEGKQAESVTLEPEALEIGAGEFAQLAATVLPEDAIDRRVNWESSDPTVATANANGVVSAKSVGNAIITATTANGIDATCLVTVVPAKLGTVTLSARHSSVLPGERTTLSVTGRLKDSTEADLSGAVIEFTVLEGEGVTLNRYGLVSTTLPETARFGVRVTLDGVTLEASCTLPITEQGEAAQYEVETLNPESDLDMARVYNNPNDGGASGGKIVTFKAFDDPDGGIGSWIQFTFEVEEDGYYRLDLRTKYYNGYGTFQAYVDGEALEDPIDYYKNTNGAYGSETLGIVALEAGTHTLRFVLVGKNDSSSGYNFAPDRLDATRVGGLGEIEVVDITALETALAEAEAVLELARSDEHPADAAALLEGAIADAVEALLDLAIDEGGIASASSTLEAATETYVAAEIAHLKGYLSALIVEITLDYNQNDYTETSWSALSNALLAAITASATATTREEVLYARDSVLTAVNGLVEKPVDPEPVDKSGLVALIATARGYNGDDYTEASYNDLQAAIADAQAVIDDDEATRQDVAQAIEDLQVAIDALVEKPVDPEPVDKSALQALYNEYKDAQQGDYTGESWSVLQGALADAKNVLDDDDATAEDVADAIETLQAAIDGLETGTPNPEPADKAALQALYDTHKDKQQGSYTGESWSALQTALANAKAVLDNAAATQGEVDAARITLQMAVDGLKVTQTPSTSKPGGSSGGSSSDGSSQGSKKYRVTKGSGAAYTGSGSVVFEIDGELSKLKAVRLGGKELARGVDYTAESGSVIITLLPALLESLESGSYSIEFVFEDGSGSATLTVRLDSTGSASASSGSGTGGEAAKTGDAANGMLYLILGLGAVAALAGTVLVRRKRAGR